MREVELIPLPDNPDAEDFCNAAIEHYGLNRKELRDYRWTRYSPYRFARNVLDDSSMSAERRADALRQIEEMRALDAPCAGMIRYFDSLP